VQQIADETLTDIDRTKHLAALGAPVDEAVSDVGLFHERNPSRITEADLARVTAPRRVAW
jgi:hypothetical protein